MTPYGFRRLERQNDHHLMMAAIAILLSAMVHLCIMYFCSDWAIGVASGMRDKWGQLMGSDRVPPMRVNTMGADPMRVPERIKGERDTPSRGPIEVSERAAEMRQTPPPALTAPPPIPREALTPGVPALNEAKVEKVDNTPWMPRQEIAQIYDRTVQDEVAALPRREIPLIERVTKAPDIVPSIDLSGRRFGKDPEPPKPFDSAEVFDTKISKGTFSVPALDANPAKADSMIAGSATGDKFGIQPGEKGGKVAKIDNPSQDKPDSPTTPKSESPTAAESDIEKRAHETQAKIAELQENIGYVPIDDLLSVNVETYSDPSEPDKTFFRVSIQPRGDKPIPIIPKDIVFVQDVSGSMTSEGVVFCRRAMSAALKTLNAADRFNVVSFRDSFQNCFPDWVPATAANVQKADTFVDGLRSFGTTDVFGSLRALMTLPRDPRRPMIAFIVTDGKPTAGLTESASIIGDFSALNNGMISIYMLGTKSNANAYLIDMLTYCNRGGSSINSGDRWDIPAAMAKSCDSIRNPVMGDITVAFDAASASEVYPRQTANLYKDTPLQFCGVCPNSTDDLIFQVRGLASDKGYEALFRLNLKRQAKAGSKDLPGLWAHQKMYYLVGQYSRHPDQQTMAEMLKLNKQYGITIPYEKELK